jgi:hypothetical protein
MSTSMTSGGTIRFVLFLALFLAFWPVAPCGANPLPAGACCMPDGSCWEIDEEFCLHEGGTYMGEGLPCTPNPCPPPMGACCYPDGICTFVSETECTPPCVWLGGGFACSPCNPCVQCSGACCWPDGRCTMESTYYCCMHGGDPNCGVSCVEPRCGTSSAPEPGGPESRRATWGTIRMLYR